MKTIINVSHPPQKRLSDHALNSRSAKNANHLHTRVPSKTIQFGADLLYSTSHPFDKPEPRELSRLDPMAASLCGPATASLRLAFDSRALSHSSATAAGRRLRLGRSVRLSPTPPSLSSRHGDAPRGPPPGNGRLAVRCGAVTTIGQSEFAAEVLGSDLPVLVEFVADWCGPCRLITPFVEWASQEYKGRLKVLKIDHDANPQLIEEYKVYGLPALILFKNGQEVPGSRREGAITKVKLKEYLDSLLESTTVV